MDRAIIFPVVIILGSQTGSDNPSLFLVTATNAPFNNQVVTSRGSAVITAHTS